MSYAAPTRKTASAAPAPKSGATVSNSLRIGEPNDSFEQEADRVAEEVMAAGGVKWSLSSMTLGSPLQRKCSCGGSGECGECKGKQTVQRKTNGAGAMGYAPPVVNEVLHSPGRPLDSAARAFFEPRFGHDFSHVRVHADARAAESAAAVNALAYTVGPDIVFAAGQGALRTAEGRRLVAHELVHVIQQGRATPSATPCLRRTATPNDLAKQAEAQKEHEKEQTTIVDQIAELRKVKADPSKGFEDPDNLLHNALQWIPEPGQAAPSTPHATLAILSPTHDTATRDPKRGRAYFDKTRRYPDIGGDYPADPDVKADDRLEYAKAGVAGQTSFTDVEIFTDSFFGVEQLKKILVHEFQHVADQSGMALVFTIGQPSAALLSAEEHYKTEFRAYWIQPSPPKAASPPPPPPQTVGQLQLPSAGPFVPPVTDDFGSSQDPATNSDPVSVTDPSACKGCTPGKQSVPTKFKNGKQEKIFWYLVRNYKDNQFDCFYVCSPEFRQIVTDFTIPESVNLANSVRIEALSQAIQAVRQQMIATDPPVIAVFAAARRLDAIDRQFLQVEEQSGPFWRQVKAHISPDLLDTITSLIKTGKTTPESPGDYEPARGSAQVA